VQKEAAKHGTAASIRRRIAHSEEQIRTLEGFGSTAEGSKALDAHRELIRVLTKRLVDFG
jgi:hypothetical protein